MNAGFHRRPAAVNRDAGASPLHAAAGLGTSGRNRGAGHPKEPGGRPHAPARLAQKETP